MIESNIIDWLEFGDYTQNLDVYSKKSLLPLYRFFRNLIKNKNFPILINFIFISLFFIQLWTISLINVPLEKEFLLDILNFLKRHTLIYDLITNKESYINIFIIFLIIVLFNAISMIICLLAYNKINLSYLAMIINLLNIVIYYFLNGPSIEISLMSISCENGAHKYLKLSCYSNSKHIFYIILSFIMIILYIFISFIYAIYCNEIDLITINTYNNRSRINCNYEIYLLIGKIILFISSFLFNQMDYEEEEHLLIKISYEGYIFLYSLFMSIYIYKNVYFYNTIMNFINHFGWYFSTWFTFMILLKTTLNFNGVSNFISIGWIIILFTIYKTYTIEDNLLITDSNILEFHSIKIFEMYKNNLLKIISSKNNKHTKVIIFGIYKKIEEFIINNQEINYQYQKFLHNKKLIRKYNKEDTLPILSIIYLLYSYYIEKLTNKNELILHMCYFLINKFNNVAYSMLLCSKIKAEKHKDLYYKYLLTEDIKDYLIFKLNKNSQNKESIKHVQIGSVILHYLYIDLFKIKIYDGLSFQIDYFDLLKNSNVTNKTAENFLKCGENIFKTRSEIKIIWDKLNELNPFNDECQRDYMLYLNEIIQDECLAREEYKKYILLKNNKFNEKYNVYHSMFIANISSVLLVDGYLSNGKILYASPNFPFLFMYNGKELLSLTVDDLLPNCVQIFHKELINDAIKYSNVTSIFKEPKDSLLKNKSNGLFNIKLFVKSVPNLSYGLIYFAYIKKVHEPNFIIILDKYLKINGFVESSHRALFSSFTMMHTHTHTHGYNLNHNLIGYHIGLILPDILTLLEYKNDEFNFIKKGFELKGYLYPVEKFKDIKSKVDAILDKIKNNKILINDFQGQIEDDPLNIGYEYNELINEYNNQKIKPLSIFYKVILKNFIDGKYKYYKVYINNDIIVEKEIELRATEFLINFDNKKINKKYTIYLNDNNTIKRTTEKKVKENGNKNEKNQKPIINNEHIFENSTISKQSKNSNYIIKENDINHEKSNKNNNKHEKYKDKKKRLNYVNSIKYNSGSQNALRGCNKIKNYVRNKKETFPLKIMKYLCYIFGLVSIILLCCNLIQQINAFNRVSKFLEDHLLFNKIKVYSAVLYSISVNIRWLSHSLYINSLSHLNEDWNSFYKNLLEDSIKTMKELQNSALDAEDSFNDILNKTFEVSIYAYKLTKNELFNYTLDNIFFYIINNGIKLLDKFEYFIGRNCKAIPKQLGLNEINLKNLIEQAYYLYSLNVDVFHQQKEEKNKIDEKFRYFPFSFLVDGIFIVLILLYYTYNTISLYNIEIEFLDKLINFNSEDFDAYIKKLDEIKKKLKNDGNDEDGKEEININDINSKKKNEDEDGYENLRDVQSSEIFDKNTNTKKSRNKQSKIQQQKRKKLNVMISFFRKNNIIFQIKITLIISLSLSYYILSILFNSKGKNDFIMFDSINDSLNRVYSDSFDIFLSLKRQLDFYENNLINCTMVGQFTPMKIKKITEITIPKFGNLIMQISSNSNFNKKTLDKFNSLYSVNACKELIEYSYEMTYCEKFWSGALAKGMEQAFTQMSVIVGTVLDELQSINNDKSSRILLDLMNQSSFIEYQQFNEYYLFKAYNKTDSIFKVFRYEKLQNIQKTIRIIIYIYLIIIFILFCFQVYFVFNFNNLLSSFLNFIGIFPTKFLINDEHFYNAIIKFGDKYF